MVQDYEGHFNSQLHNHASFWQTTFFVDRFGLVICKYPIEIKCYS